MRNKYIFVFGLLFLASCHALKTNTKTMNLATTHSGEKDVSTHVIFTTQENKVVSLQILKGKQLKEHTTKVPAFLVCVTGNARYKDENGISIDLKSGDYVKIEPQVKHWVDAQETSNLLLIK